MKGDSACKSAPAGNHEVASPVAGSGIDWSIFNDTEDDAFGWLLRSNLSSDAASADVDALNAHAGVRALDGVSMAQELRSAMGSVSVSPLHARRAAPSSSAVAARIFSGLRPAQSQAAGADGDGNDSGCSDGDANSEGTSVMTMAASKNERSLKRKKPSGNTSSSDGAGHNEVADDANRKLLRREKNLVSVREFRKRKTKQLEQNEAKLRRLEAENIDLKMRLKIGKEALATEQREKQQIKEQMREMLARGASEHEVAQFLDMYKVTYSDYGPKRQEKLHFHLDCIRELLLPTQVTKLCLYSVEQGVNMLARDSVIRDDPMAVPDSAAATMSLWSILAEKLEVSEAQQRQILQRREAIRMVRDDLEHALSIVKQLEEVTDSKNTALEAQVAELQHILTPTQATKFIIWVKENPAFMYMLDKLVDSTLIATEA